MMRRSLFLIVLYSFSIFAQTSNQYQIGPVWSKKPVSAADLSQDAILEKVAKSTVKIFSSTGFYIGKFGGQHLVITNFHVCPFNYSCAPAVIKFDLLGFEVVANERLFSSKEIDLAILSIELQDPAHEGLLQNIGTPFAFKAPILKGDELLTVGYGVEGNAYRELMYSADEDCKVYSRDDEFHLMSDPDQQNPANYDAWSFATGCDVSHGDSGSAMVNRKTGEVIGLIWTGKVPKAPEVQDPLVLSTWYANDSAEVWSELAYAVPAAKIYNILKAKWGVIQSTPADRKSYRDEILEVVFPELLK